MRSIDYTKLTAQQKANVESIMNLRHGERFRTIEEGGRVKTAWMQVNQPGIARTEYGYTRVYLTYYWGGGTTPVDLTPDDIVELHPEDAARRADGRNIRFPYAMVTINPRPAYTKPAITERDFEHLIDLECAMNPNM